VSGKFPFGPLGDPPPSISNTCRRHLICQFLHNHGKDRNQSLGEPEVGLLDPLLKVLEFKLLTYLSAPSRTYSEILELIRLYGQLTPLLKDKLHTQWDLTLITIVSPCLCNWNRLFQSTIFPTPETPYIPPFKSLSEINYVLQGGTLYMGDEENPLIYHNEARLSATDHSLTVEDAIAFPFGWSFAIEDYCHDYNYHPHCHYPNLRNVIEERFADWAINSQNEDQGENRMGMLDEHISTLHLNTSGRQFQWLQSSTVSTTDDMELRHKLTRIYDDVDQLQGSIYHSKKGLRITIPEDKWINWKNTSPKSQEQFTRVAWCQMTQFNKEAMMTGLIDELSSVRSYMTELATVNRAYVHYNPLVIQDLATSQPLLTNPWDEWKINHPSHFHLPYANILLLWNSLTSKWYYPTPTDAFNPPINSPSPLSPNSSGESSQSHSSMEISSTDSCESSKFQSLPLRRMRASADLQLECNQHAFLPSRGSLTTYSPTDYMNISSLNQQPFWYHNALPPTPHTTPVEDMI